MAQSPQAPLSREKVTVVGCVVRDSAFRPTRAIRNSSAEFLLVTGAPVGNPLGAVGTSGGTAARITTFGLIGTQERQLGAHVGRRVQIVGTIETDSRDSQQPTGGATDPVSGAGVPPGVPESLRGSSATTAGMPRLNIVSMKPARGAC
jgi:hypothetical protein